MNLTPERAREIRENYYRQQLGYDAQRFGLPVAATPAPPATRTDHSRRAIAIHEAAHASTATRCAWNLVSVSTVAGSNEHGLYDGLTVCNQAHEARATPLNKIMFAVSGEIAVAINAGQTPTRSAIAASLAHDGPTSDGYDAAQAVREAEPDCGNAWESRTFKLAYELALNHVRDNWKAITRLADFIEGGKTISGAAAHTILNSEGRQVYRAACARQAQGIREYAAMRSNNPIQRQYLQACVLAGNY